ncbi:MAG TPA: ATPase, T2SS/T4P/T4SS family [Anaerolineales bacterium]|nr:ATPase, T2SS/T4P/T4SS family [Anaerolineales bacterium]
MFGNSNGKGLSSLYDVARGTERLVDEGLKDTVANEVIDQINREFPVNVLRSPTDTERQRIQERINTLVGQAFRRSNAYSGYQTDGALAAELGRRLMGLGFLDLLLPPARTDLSEICVYSSGLVQVMKKNSVRWETLQDVKPDPHEIIRVLDRILGPQNKSLNEANPTVNAKLPATLHNPGGGRIKALHPVIAPPGRNPSINIRLFEQKPVLPEWILEREMMSPEMMAILQIAMEQGYRILITGGTRTGKTTLLSALCNYLPSAWRIVKIEDPEEIWIERSTVQTIEARPAALGTEIQPYTLANAVDDALRMAPDYLILGEVRDGHAGLSLFRAMMTGHSGACTFHADNPREAVRRLTTVLGADAGVGATDAVQLIAEAVDLLVQIGIRDEVRRVTVIANLAKELSNGDIHFELIYRFDERSLGSQPRWEKVGELRPRILAETSFQEVRL